MRRYLLLILIVGWPYFLSAQYYLQGEDPSAIKWMQINTTNFQIIYPSNFETKAQKVAVILNNVYDYAGYSLKTKPHKISVILHTSTIRSNGFAAWAPARVEFFTTPDQSIYAQNWLDQLAIHEFRHVAQIDKIGTELPCIFKIILGEQAAAIAIGAYLPYWFLEGDAVATETALSHSGRGRVPSFEMELKAQCVEKGFYSYDKAYLGSYKDYIPDYYQLGYQMVAGIRTAYGSEVWPEVLHHIARNPLSLNAFSKGLKLSTGKNHTELYQEIFSNLSDQWIQKDKSLIKTKFNIISRLYNQYINYRYPYPLNDSTVFAVKSSIHDLTRFVLMDLKGEEKIIFTPGNLFDESITCGDKKIYWIENKADVRWTHREFSLLRILNLASGRVIEKRFRNKIFAPSLSPLGDYLAVVELDSLNKSSLLLLSPTTGETLRELFIPENLFLITPSWSEDGNHIYAVILGDKGKTLARIDPLNGAVHFIFPFSTNEFYRPIEKDNRLYYSASLNGTDNIYSYDIMYNINYKLTSSRFGARDVQLSSDGTKLIYSDYSANGYRIVSMTLNDALYSITDPSVAYSYSLADQISEQERGIPDFSDQDSIKYPSRPYSKLGNLFNFHSWSPVYVDTESEEIRSGFSLLSQNKLSTAITQLGYDYSTTNQTGKWVAKFDYNGLFPELKLDISYGNEKSSYLQLNNYLNALGQMVRVDTQHINFFYKILDIQSKINLPINLTHGKMYRYIQPEFQFGYTHLWQKSSTPDNFFRGSVIPLTYRLYAHNLLKLSEGDLQSRFGQIIDLTYRNSPWGDRDLGYIWSTEGFLYLPGVARHHGIRVYGAYQKRNSAESAFSDLINYPRGYSNINSTERFTLRSDYVLPLFYPDWSLGKLSYFKRFSLRLFYDYASAIVPINNGANQFRYNFSSTGGEITTDCNWLRLSFPSQLGFRSSYLIGQKNFNFEFLLSINLGSL